MERVTINTTKEFRKAVEEYRHDHAIKTLSKAVIELAWRALLWDGYIMPNTVAAKKWGGARVSRKKEEEV